MTDFPESPLRDPVSEREILRHMIAVVCYRTEKVLRDPPPAFAGFLAGPTSRTPVQILAHMGDLFDWTWWLLQGEHRWSNSAPLPWPEECTRFFAALQKVDALLQSGATLRASSLHILQGPIADALTHAGQIAMLRRLAGGRVKGENYFKAEIIAGRLGADQSSERLEFE